MRISDWSSDVCSSDLRTYPKAVSGTTKKGSFQVKDNPLVTSGIALSHLGPPAGQTVTASLIISNASSTIVNIVRLLVAARDPDGSSAERRVGIECDSTVRSRWAQEY